ncbi:DUF3570 domain-containing protein [Pseudoduganella sp. FT25W]|uniref:DUF3570 domain-containing protein n=2 Tax=Duganella alba TaxID=2666081 RepID=A0A6L5QF68_9BURK|nr:DUF3570 domain-containing protein [Duganella alba]MRX16789.1 DUF3570 domain-containing protein [Duganella alba]
MQLMGSLPTLAPSLLTAALALPLAAQAETVPDRATISLKHLDYLDSQPDADRIRVKASALNLVTPLAGAWSLDATVVHDAISGASPAYHTAALTTMRDTRRAAEAEVSRYFERASVTVGASVSSEADYLSRGGTLQGSLSSADQNTTWSAGLSFSNDDINPTNHVVRRERRHTGAALLGLTRIVGVNDLVQLNLGRSLGHGYFSDPYKVFDQRPRERAITTLMGRWNHHIASLKGTMRLSYRYYRDSWQIRAHTLGLEYVQPLPGGWSVTPALRLYTQGAARFYVDAEPESPFVPNPPAGWTYYAEDQRLSAFGAVTLGFKVSKQLGADWQVDLKLERYEQRSSWRRFGAGSPGLPSFAARSWFVGLSRQF